MTNREDLEYNKFDLDGGNVILKTAEGVGPSSAVLEGKIDDLESKKFTSGGDVRVITTF